jgi:hypothetical protein
MQPAVLNLWVQGVDADEQILPMRLVFVASTEPVLLARIRRHISLNGTHLYADAQVEVLDPLANRCDMRRVLKKRFPKDTSESTMKIWAESEANVRVGNARIAALRCPGGFLPHPQTKPRCCGHTHTTGPCK